VLFRSYSDQYSNRAKVVPFFKQHVVGGSVASKSETIDEMIEKLELEYRRARALFSEKDEKMYNALFDVCVWDFIPQFFIKHRNRLAYTMDDLKQKTLLVRGLDKLIGR